MTWKARNAFPHPPSSRAVLGTDESTFHAVLMSTLLPHVRVCDETSVNTAVNTGVNKGVNTGVNGGVNTRVQL